MATNKHNKIPMKVWCPLIPFEEYHRLMPFEEELSKISEAYDDWLVTMRKKPVIGTSIGVLLDRIRILMICIGIACQQNRDLAETVQSILTNRLRLSALKVCNSLSGNSLEAVKAKQILIKFFENLRFTRDVDPREELETAFSSIADSTNQTTGSSKFRQLFFHKSEETKTNTQNEKKRIINRALLQGTNVVKILYIRLLSQDPWGSNGSI